MAVGGYKPRQFRSLKEAERKLIDAGGGLREAAKVCRVQTTTLYRYTDDTEENKDRHMPVDVVEALEQEAGLPIVTEYLAERAVRLLLPVPAETSQTDLNIDLARTGEHVSELFRDWANAVANDGLIDRKEARQLLTDNMELVRTLMRMRSDLEARIADPDTPEGPIQDSDTDNPRE